MHLILSLFLKDALFKNSKRQEEVAFSWQLISALALLFRIFRKPLAPLVDFLLLDGNTRLYLG